MTSAPKSLRERSQAASPEAAAAAEAKREKETTLKFRWPKTKGPRHFRGLVTIPDEVFELDTTDSDGVVTGVREVMKVIIDPSAEIYEANDRRDSGDPLTFYVSLPKEGEDEEVRPNAEMVLTNKTIRDCETARRLNITHYAELDGHIVDMSADVHIEPPRTPINKKTGEPNYPFNSFFYRVNWVGATDGSKQAPVSSAPDASDVQALALSLVGKEPGSVKKMDLVKWTATHKEELADQVALTAFIQLPSTNFLEYASTQGLIGVGEDGKIVNQVAG